MLSNITSEPTNSIGFRPTLSMTNYWQLVGYAIGTDLGFYLHTMPGIVLMRKTTPVTPVAKRATVPLVSPRLVKTLDA